MQIPLVDLKAPANLITKPVLEKMQTQLFPVGADMATPFDDEKAILRLVRNEHVEQATSEPFTPVDEATMMAAKQGVMSVYLSEGLENYLIELVMATRSPELYGDDLKDTLTFGASPRATIALDRAVRAKAWLNGRDFVTPDDIQEMAPSVLRHRIGISYIAEANGLDKDQLIAQLIERVVVP